MQLPLLINMQNAIVFACFLFPRNMFVEYSLSIKNKPDQITSLQPKTNSIVMGPYKDIKV